MKKIMRIKNLTVPILSTLSMITAYTVLHMSRPLLSSTYFTDLEQLRKTTSNQVLSRTANSTQAFSNLNQELSQAENIDTSFGPVNNIIPIYTHSAYNQYGWVDSTMRVMQVNEVKPEDIIRNTHINITRIYSGLELMQLYNSSPELSKQYSQSDIDSIIAAEYHKMSMHGAALPKTVNLEFLMAKKKRESSNNRFAVSGADALGLYQITLPIWEHYGVKDWKDKWFIPEVNAHIAMKHYADEDALLRAAYPDYRDYPIKIRQLILAGMDNWGFGKLMKNDGNFSKSTEETISHIKKISKDLGVNEEEYYPLLFSDKNISSRYKYVLR